MTDFIIKKLPYELTSNAGLALVGQYFKRLRINQSSLQNPRNPHKTSHFCVKAVHQISHKTLLEE